MSQSAAAGRYAQCLQPVPFSWDVSLHAQETDTICDVRNVYPMRMLVCRSECGLRPRQQAHCMSAAPAQHCTTFCLLAATAAS